MAAFVLDTSVTMAWCFTDEHDTYALGVLKKLEDDEAIVPFMWTLEVGNVVLVAERRNRLTTAESEQFLALLRLLPITVDIANTEEIPAKIIDLGRQYHLSTYDASFLDLALNTGLPLATTDSPLRRAMVETGVPLYKGK
ncbi:MAG TPA: type II toxin-antitoxin system VapC family toxin [Armatimonadota bacterium]|jgi:predicted nucleic acid-binding protein